MKLEKSVKMDIDYCPSCGGLLDGASGATGKQKPAPGDLSICLHCTEFLVFKDDLKLRKLTEDDVKDIADETLHTLYEARRKIQLARMVK